ncbi:uncharacterized protein LOC125779660 [Bactrocera dorsalis]|uniref:Uncharacterized protein LOC125779660 n=1 Tax=Bactrocera dorsalis TaxID=27457 RepID=A0ABM3K5X8_BACDO|nr:uncharacterized protein LOC125779660 [Bactrocera dorsalis]
MHLELAGDLSSIAFIAAFKRFTNRRGYCQHIYSENDTNFVDAEKELRLAYERCIRDERVSSYFANAQIFWHFNPPSAPHMGGFWEGGIKRIKYHLKRALDTSLLTYEEFATVLTEVEACVNSRPICFIPTNVNDFEVLTPGHFVIGEPLKGLPDPDVEVFKGTIFQRWQIIVPIRQHFWNRWRDEYLVSLQRRSKWIRSTPSLQKDDIVIIHEGNVPPTKWKLGRVIGTSPETDGQVRVVNVKTSEGELLRPVIKLSLLPTKGDIFSI